MFVTTEVGSVGNGSIIIFETGVVKKQPVASIVSVNVNVPTPEAPQSTITELPVSTPPSNVPPVTVQRYECPPVNVVLYM